MLRERIQQIDLAKTIYPVYDADEEIWMEVTAISSNMKRAKEDMQEVDQLQVITLADSDTSSNLVSQLLKSVVDSPVKKYMLKKRKW